MENFSKFFDDIMSGKSNTPREFDSTPLSANNNDNNIDNTNNIYNGEFPIEDYYLIANEIIFGAICTYKKLYNSLVVPYQFIGYYFQVFGKITLPRTNYLNTFLILFHNKKNNVSNAISVFNKLYLEECDIRQIKKSSIFNGLKEGFYLVVDNSLIKEPIGYSKNIDSKLKDAITDTRSFIREIEDSAEKSGFKANYLDFLSRTTSTSETTQVSLKRDNPSPNKEKRMITPPKAETEARISTITLPKLKTGRIFPTSFTHSRIDSAHFASSFLQGDRAYYIIKKYKITRVQYTDGFEEKRKALFESQKSSFDLF